MIDESYQGINDERHKIVTALPIKRFYCASTIWYWKSNTPSFVPDYDRKTMNLIELGMYKPQNVDKFEIRSLWGIC